MTLLLFIVVLGASSCVLGIANPAKRSLLEATNSGAVRVKRANACENIMNLVKIKTEGSKMDINFSALLYDRVLSLGPDMRDMSLEDICYDTNEFHQLERENKVYVTNNHELLKRETPNGKSQNSRPLWETPDDDFVNSRQRRVVHSRRSGGSGGSGELVKSNSNNNVRLLERLAVKADEIESKMEIAEAMLDNKNVAENRELFGMYKQRMKILLQDKMKLMIKEHQTMIEEYDNVEVPDQFHR